MRKRSEPPVLVAIVSAAGNQKPVLVSPVVVIAGKDTVPAENVATPVADRVVNAPVLAVVAPIVVPLIVPPVIATALVAADSLANGIPPAVEPSCTTTVFFVVSTVTSRATPVNVECSEVVPPRNCT